MAYDVKTSSAHDQIKYISCAFHLMFIIMPSHIKGIVKKGFLTIPLMENSLSRQSSNPLMVAFRALFSDREEVMHRERVN